MSASSSLHFHCHCLLPSFVILDILNGLLSCFPMFTFLSVMFLTDHGKLPIWSSYLPSLNHFNKQTPINGCPSVINTSEWSSMILKICPNYPSIYNVGHLSSLSPRLWHSIIFTPWLFFFLCCPFCLRFSLLQVTVYHPPSSNVIICYFSL